MTPSALTSPTTTSSSTSSSSVELLVTRRHYMKKVEPTTSHDSSPPSFSCSSRNNHNEDKNNDNNMTRRKAFSEMTAAATLLSFSTTISPASGMTATGQASQSFVCNQTPTSALEDIYIGKGEWLPKTLNPKERGRSQASSNANASMMERSILPPNFATYATRFLICYDEGFQNWWKENECKYSLLSAREQRNNLGKSFGSLARSIQLSLEGYILDGMNGGGGSIGNNVILSKNNDSLAETTLIQQRYEDLLMKFVACYAIPESTKGGRVQSDARSRGEDAMRQLGLLFATLPKEYQPIRGLKEITTAAAAAAADDDNWKDKKSFSKETWMENFTQDFSQLLPYQYKSNYDTQLDCYVIQPTLSLYEIGVNDEFGQNAIATAFGPLSCLPLQRQNPNISPNIYLLLGINGALACALTHSLVIPFDVVKTRMQTDPEGYSNILEGTMSIAKSEGIQGFTLGAEATIAGYFWYGLSVYPSYSFFKWYMSHSLLSPAFATSHADGIALVAGAIAAVIASVGLTPLEACRIRTVAEPQVYRDIGLAGTMKLMAEENEAVGWRALYAGLPSLMIRQVIFGSVKFLAFERACEAFFITWPFLKDTMVTALGVTLISGALSGALSSVVSQPADSVLTYVAKNKRGDDDESLGILSIVSMMIEREGAGSLFRGLGSRCIWASAIISGQFLLYDIFRTALGINSDDLSQFFQFAIGQQS